MAHLPVQCQNCGARYKIPETFKSDSAKCKGCGTMIDVKAARAASGDSEREVTPASKPAPRTTGGTRKPRQAAGASSKRRRGGGEDGDGEETVKATASSRRSKRRGRRGEDGDDDGEGEEGGRRYEKKKDNTPIIAGIAIDAMTIVAAVFYFTFDWGDDDGSTETVDKNGKTAAAKKEDDKGKSDEGANTDADKEAEEADAKKAAADKKAKDAAAKKKKDDAAKKKALDAAAKREIKDADDVFKPLSVLKKLDRPASVTEEEEKEANGHLDDLRTGSGLPAIRAPRKLEAMGWKILPLVANRLLELDYSKMADSEYSYLLTNRVILPLTRWEFGFRQAKQTDSFELKDGHENALRVKNVHIHARIYWSSDEAWGKYKAKYPEKFN
jgi:hypothetical protein